MLYVGENQAKLNIKIATFFNIFMNYFRSFNFTQKIVNKIAFQLTRIANFLKSIIYYNINSVQQFVRRVQKIIL